MRRDPGSTSNSFTVEIVDDTGLPVPSLVAATFPAVSYQRLNAAAVSVTLSDLAAIGSAFSAGGVFEIGNGRYRLDIADAAFATATDQLSIIGEASGKRLICPPIEVRYESANAVQIGGAAQTAGDLAALTNALQTSVNNLNNLSALANLFGPSTLVRPANGSIVYPFTFVVKDSEGHLVDVDTNAVTLTATNAAGTDRSANLSAVTHAGTGEYTFTYTVATAHADEGLRITASGTVQSATRKAYTNCDVADADSLAALAAIQAQTDKLAFDGSNNVKSTPQTAVQLAATQPNYAPSKTGDAMTLTAAGLDAILIESGITAGVSLVNDSGTQLTSINARQLMALAGAALAGLISGADTTNIPIKPAGKGSASARITATVDTSGNRIAIVLRVPD